MGINSNRSRFTRFAALALATVAVGAFATGGANADTSRQGRAEVIELQLKDLEYETLDLGKAGPSLGDMSVYCATAVEKGRVVGRGGGTSQVLSVSGGKVTSQVVITVELKRGTLTMQSLRSDDASSLDMAITGGTGDFRDARGNVRYWDINTPKERLRAEILH
ncbi:dirigent protein [Streptomyces sp. NPDC004111]|uniref:dirigent protein n=1 Tax=Streptomyces sp. NPDC004111 TaxID=3364690 RepID=UPI00367EFFF2